MEKQECKQKQNMGENLTICFRIKIDRFRSYGADDTYFIQGTLPILKMISEKSSKGLEFNLK